MHIGHSGRCAASATSVGPEEKGHDSYRVAGSNMKKKRASPCLVGIKSARRVTGEERGVRRLGTPRLVLLTPWGTVLFSAARLSPVNFFSRGSPFPAGPHHASRARKRKEATTQTPCTDTDVPAPSGEGACYRHCHCALSHGTVPLEQLVSRRRAAKLLRLCPPRSPPSNGDQQTCTPKRPCTVRPVTFCSSGGSSNLRTCPVGGRDGLEGASG